MISKNQLWYLHPPPPPPPLPLQQEVLLSPCRACSHGSVPEVLHHCGRWAAAPHRGGGAARGQRWTEPSCWDLPNNADLQGGSEETVQLWTLPGEQPNVSVQQSHISDPSTWEKVLLFLWFINQWGKKNTCLTHVCQFCPMSGLGFKCNLRFTWPQLSSYNVIVMTLKQILLQMMWTFPGHNPNQSLSNNVTKLPLDCA